MKNPSNTTPPPPLVTRHSSLVTGGPAAPSLPDLFALCERLAASDIHLSPSLPPYLRIQGTLAPAPGLPPIPPAHARHLAEALVRAAHGPDAAPLDTLLAPRGSLDGACTSPSGSRYRFNIFRRLDPFAHESPLPIQQSPSPDGRSSAGHGGPGAEPPSIHHSAFSIQHSSPAPSVAIRRLDDRFRSLAELGLPSSLLELTRFPHGLVIVTGPTGSGKSTTLATLLDAINQTRPAHIITIEDPVEYVHRPIRALVDQRQVGLDAPSFHSALVDALREDPDIILVGEIRETETIRTAITAAETGHLVFTTLHSGDCPGAIERFVSVFPAAEQDSIRRQLALVLRGVVAQHLLPSERPGSPPRRLPAAEILRATPAVANLIATGKTAQLYTAIETGTAYGMQTLEQDLLRLVRQGDILPATALAIAHYPDALRHRLP